MPNGLDTKCGNFKIVLKRPRLLFNKDGEANILCLVLIHTTVLVHNTEVLKQKPNLNLIKTMHEPNLSPKLNLDSMSEWRDIGK